MRSVSLLVYKAVDGTIEVGAVTIQIAVALSTLAQNASCALLTPLLGGRKGGLPMFACCYPACLVIHWAEF